MHLICLTAKELEQITGKVKASAQIRWLRRHGFTVKARADGRPVVSRSHFEAVMGGNDYQTKAQEYEPDFSAF